MTAVLCASSPELETDLTVSQTTRNPEPLQDPSPEITSTTSRRHEAGYILAQSALLMIPLMLFAALATDLGFWYVQARRSQGAADAAALAGAPMLPNFDDAEAEGRAAAIRNGFVDATPNDNSDFETGPLPQVEVSSPRPGSLQVRIRQAERSFLGGLVLGDVVIERFAIAEAVAPINMGNPTSAIGSGTIPEAELGVPPAQSWIALNAYCTDAERGDHFGAGYTNGTQSNIYNNCGPTATDVIPEAFPNPNFDPDAYVFVAEMQPGSAAIDLSIFEPGYRCDAATNTLTTSDSGGRIHYRVYGPSTTKNHRAFVDANAPFATGLLPADACYNNSPKGDGWFPIAQSLSLPSAEGGFYYIQLASRNPSLFDPDPADSFWLESGINQFSVMASPAGTTKACVFSAANTTCPKLYALEWLPLYRNLPANEDEFFLAEIVEEHAGATLVVRVFDASDGADSMQFENPDGNSVPFQYRWADHSVLNLNGTGYRETSMTQAFDTCMWAGAGGNPCLVTSPYSDFNDHLIEIHLEIPSDYTCSTNCWWKVRYSSTGAIGDRTNWSIGYIGDPLRLVE